MKKTTSQEGFALILALLALMLLTSLGLSLSTTTSTELQIATNHRWSEQARYNAEAGIEYGLQLLTTVSDWETILPQRRLPPTTQPWSPTAAVAAPAANDGTLNRVDAWGNPSRNFENWSCDSRGFGQGYGVVLDTGVGSPTQYLTNLGGLPLNGAFTLWVRRPVMWNPLHPDQLEEYPGTDPVTGLPKPAPAPGFGVMILVAEGVAPFTPGLANQGAANRATQIIELVISQGFTQTTWAGGGPGGCNARQGQAGGSAAGTNAQGCAMLDGGSVVAALTGAANTQNAGNLR
jgi:hypothetical protein